MVPLLRLSTRSEKRSLCIVSKTQKLNLKPLSHIGARKNFSYRLPAFQLPFLLFKSPIQMPSHPKNILDSLTSVLESVSASLWQGFSPPALNSDMGILQFLPHSCTVASSMPQTPLANTHRVG